MQENGKVDFLIVGTQKGGTTALASFLGQHPQIFMPQTKEVHFFDRTCEYLDTSTGLPRYNAYHARFKVARSHQLWGEATPIYMFLPVAAARIHDYHPGIKLIFLLRNPVERAFSQYKMERGRNWERWPFALAAALEFPRVRLLCGDPDNARDAIRVHTYLSRGFYSHQIERFLRQFPRENCLFLKSEELLAEHDRVLRQVFNFLQVDPEFRVPPARIFASPQGILNPLVARILSLVYWRERRRLERLVSLDFSKWVSPYLRN